MSETGLVTIIQKFGYDAVNDAAKMLIQLRNGQQYYVWYYFYDDEIIPPEGSAVRLSYSLDSYSSMYDMHKLTNIGMGRETNIMRFAKVN